MKKINLFHSWKLEVGSWKYSTQNQRAFGSHDFSWMHGQLRLASLGKKIAHGLTRTNTDFLGGRR